MTDKYGSFEQLLEITADTMRPVAQRLRDMIVAIHNPCRSVSKNTTSCSITQTGILRISW